MISGTSSNEVADAACGRSLAALPPVESLDLIGNVDTFEAACTRAFADPSLQLLRADDGSIVAFRHADLKALVENPTVGNTPATELIQWTLQHPEADQHPGEEPVGGALARWVCNQIFTTNPPLHRPERMIMVRHFGPKIVAGLRPKAKAIIDEIVATLPADREIDLFSALTSRLATRLSGELLGMTPDEQVRMGDAVHRMSQLFLLAPTFEQFKSADDGAADLIAVMSEAAERGLAAPDHNLVKQLNAELGELKHETDLDRTGMVPESVGLLLAANIFDAAHTTSILAANTIYLLLANPAALEQVRRDRSLVAAAVSEGIRLAPPLAVTPRFLLGDVEHGGVRIPECTKVLMLWEVGNRDPAVFRDPHRFDLQRKPSGELSFGGGAHLCPGRHLGRMLSEIVVAALTAPDIAVVLADDRQLWVGESILRHVRALPVLISRIPA